MIYFALNRAIATLPSSRQLRHVELATPPAATLESKVYGSGLTSHQHYTMTMMAKLRTEPSTCVTSGNGLLLLPPPSLPIKASPVENVEIHGLERTPWNAAASKLIWQVADRR
jgi:hypothetical protein